MNTKTTIVLLVLVLALGLVVVFTRDKAAPDVKPDVHTLVDVKPGDVTAIAVTSADGDGWSAAKSVGPNGMPKWTFAKPANVTADASEVDGLVADVTALKSTADTTATVSQANLEHPRYTVTLTAGGKATTLAIGDKMPVTDGLYVRVNGASKVDVAPTSILTTLDRPGVARPRAHLFDVTSADIDKVAVVRPDQPPVAIAKSGQKWDVTAPTTMPADSPSVETLISSVLTMEPTQFVDPVAGDDYGLNPPAAIVELDVKSAPTVVKVGRFQDLNKRNVYVQLPNGVIAVATSTVATEADRKPIEYRDRGVMSFDPKDVRRITIATSQPAATQPAAVAESHSEVVIRPRPILMGPTAPTTMPTTRPTTAPATMPTTLPTTAPSSKWVLSSDRDGPADDARVGNLLDELKTLRADKFLDPAPAAKPGKSYDVTIELTAGPPVRLHLVEAADGSGTVGTVDGLTFELSTPVASDLTGDFKPGSAPPPAPPMMPPGMNPMMMRRGMGR